MTPETSTVEETAATLFSMLADEIRVGILRELANATEPLAFADLCTRVGCEDSGRFNYHLSRLQTDLVETTPDGYVLTDVGERAAMTMGVLSTPEE